MKELDFIGEVFSLGFGVKYKKNKVVFTEGGFIRRALAEFDELSGDVTLKKTFNKLSEKKKEDLIYLVTRYSYSSDKKEVNYGK